MTQKSNNSSVFQTVLLVILVLFSAFQVAFLLGITPNLSKTATNDSNGIEKVIRDALLQHEYSKVGGEENYNTITELQKALLQYPQYEANIESQKRMLEQIKGASPNNADTATPTVTSQTLTDDQQKSLLSGAVIEGNADADIVVIEYSDLECPFCIRQHNDNKIAETIHAEYGDKVATIFKNHRGVDHAGTEVKALGLLCANKIGGNEKYVQFYKGIFAGSTTNSYYPVDKLADLAKEIGLDVAAWQSCVDNKEMLAQFAAETREAQQFDLNGTPGTLIFNRKTGAYTTVSGAYPYAQFKSAIDTLLAQ